MGNCLKNRRFFDRYLEAEEDYYETFSWLVKFKKSHKKTKICIKHHPGDYSNDRDPYENTIIKNSGIIYLKNKLNSYLLAEDSKMCVSYCSTMILELNGFPQLGRHLYDTKHKRVTIKRPCKGLIDRKESPFVPSYYLDPGHRNRQFCRWMDDVHKHNCEGCKGNPLEIFEPYRLCTYEQFERKALQLLK